MSRIAVIDGNSLMHRAFHAVPSYMMAPDGKHTNAVFGFVSMLLKLVEEFSPDAIVCAFDAGIPAFRFAAIEKYKAQRPPTDPDLKEQFPLIEDLLCAMGIPVVKLEGWEGDDILGSLAARGDALGEETLLVTGDRDAFQLASEHTKIVATKKGLSDVLVYGPDEVLERYGVTPALVPDFIALRGDPSDNIPGVPGIGEKTAAKLLGQYGSIEGIYEHVDDLKGKAKTSVLDNSDVMFAGREVATIVRDLDIDIDLDSIAFPDFDPDEVIAAFKKLGITSHVSKILALLDEKAAGGVQTQVQDALQLEILKGEEASSALAKALESFDGSAECRDGNWISLLYDTSASEMLFGNACRLVVGLGAVGEGTGEGKVAIFEEEQAILDALESVMRRGCAVMVDAKPVMQLLAPKDSSLPCRMQPYEFDMRRVFDLTLAAYLLNSTSSGYSLEGMLYDFLGVRMKAPEKARKGQQQPGLDDEELALRAVLMPKLAAAMRGRLDEDESARCFDQIDMPLIPVLVSLERAGLELDVERMYELSEELGLQISLISKEIYKEVGEEFNLGSPKQLSRILFEKLGLPARRKTRSGYSTDASVLSSLAEMHPVPSLVLEYRELSKIKSTYLDTLPNDLLGDKRIHTTFNQTITATGRLSSSDPNLQNIPVRTELGRQIRTAFVPYAYMRDMDGGAVFLSADYSQIELRLLAQLSGDQGLIDAFRHGSDFHSSTAASIFGISLEDVTPELRSRAKAVNFGIVYGQQAFGLARSLSIPIPEAQEMIDRYFDAYPGVKTYLDGLVEQARTQGFVETMFGRKRRVPEMLSSNVNQRQAAERVAMNHPMQGSAADIIKLAMVAVAEKMSKMDLQAEMILQIHDELDFSCPSSEVEELSAMVKETMENVVELDVPMIVSISYGPTWADAK